MNHPTRSGPASATGLDDVAAQGVEDYEFRDIDDPGPNVQGIFQRLDFEEQFYYERTRRWCERAAFEELGWVLEAKWRDHQATSDDESPYFNPSDFFEPNIPTQKPVEESVVFHRAEYQDRSNIKAYLRRIGGLNLKLPTHIEQPLPFPLLGQPRLDSIEDPELLRHLSDWELNSSPSIVLGATLSIPSFISQQTVTDIEGFLHLSSESEPTTLPPIEASLPDYAFRQPDPKGPGSGDWSYREWDWHQCRVVRKQDPSEKQFMETYSLSRKIHAMYREAAQRIRAKALGRRAR